MKSIATLFQHPFISFPPYPVYIMCLSLLVLDSTHSQFLCFVAQNSLKP